MKSRVLPQFRMFLRLTGLFLAWCLAVGGFNHAATGDWPTINHILDFTISCAQLGALLGAIAVAVAILFGEVRNPQRFKLALAICVSVLPASATVFMLFLIMAFMPDLALAEAVLLLPTLSSVPLVVWFSQIVARHYLREISPRKRKQKPA